jgi:hypothetical protein
MGIEEKGGRKDRPLQVLQKIMQLAEMFKDA